MAIQVRGARENHLRGIDAEFDGLTVVTGVSGSGKTSPWWCAPSSTMADWLVELGPGGGPDGERVIASGSPDKLAHGVTRTAPYLRRALKTAVRGAT